jgi:spermidine synthase
LGWGRLLLDTQWGGVAWGSSGYFAICGLWLTLALFPWCVFMGATFPLALSAFEKGSRSRSFSYLYLANVLGAACGTAVCAYFLVEMLGFQGTLRVASGLNFLIAAAAFILSARLNVPEERALPQTVAPPIPNRGLLGLLFMTGLISMGMEIAWMRQLTPYLGPFVYSFANILIVYLLATFLGSKIYRASAGKLEDKIWAVVGLLALLPLVFTDPLFPAPHGPARGLIRILGIAPFCGALGYLTPMLVDRWSGGEPGKAGKAYAFNILGCILGPLLAGFWLLPSLGERWTLIVLSLPLFAAGLIYALKNPPALRARYAAAVAASLLLVKVSRSFEGRLELSHVHRDYEATVAAGGVGMRKMLLVNGVGMTRLTPVTKMMAHLPAAFLDQAPQDSLVICFGMGTTFRSLMSWGGRVTAVDVIPSVPRFFDYFHNGQGPLLSSPRARIVIDDGRRFLSRSTDTYNVIIIDPPPPVETAASSLLYSKEFYVAVKKRLRPGGILQQWFPESDPVVLSAIVEALHESFPYLRVFVSVEGWGFHFIASNQATPLLSAKVLARHLPPAAAADIIEWGPALTAEGQFSLILKNEIPPKFILAALPASLSMRDDRPVNEYFLLRKNFPAFWSFWLRVRSRLNR